MTPEERQIIAALGFAISGVFYQVMSSLILYAIFSPLGILAIRDIVWKPARRTTMYLILFGLISATGYMIVVTRVLVGYILSGMVKNIATPLADKRISTNEQIVPWTYAVQGFELIPLVTNDSLLIWRAWVLFSKRAWALYILLTFWLATSGIVLAALINLPKPGIVAEKFILASKVVTFGTNLITTGIIGYILWNHRKFVGNYLRPVGGQTRVSKILALLFEIGFVYCLVQLFVVIITIIDEINDRKNTSTSAQMLSPATIFIQTASAFCGMISMLYPVITAVLINISSSITAYHDTVIEITNSQIREPTPGNP